MFCFKLKKGKFTLQNGRIDKKKWRYDQRVRFYQRGDYQQLRVSYTSTIFLNLLTIYVLKKINDRKFRRIINLWPFLRNIQISGDFITHYQFFFSHANFVHAN
uniref:Uncharacterized protein n=1 Tax=Cacopsylla melanoneura TaxID=428564 RepID=A0A8D8TE91_9HEMI